MRDVAGNLKLNTSFGKIDVDGPATEIHAVTSNGKVQIKQAKGPISAKSSFGEVNIDAPSADVDAETSNGSIHVRGATVRSVRIQVSALSISPDKTCKSTPSHPTVH